MSDASDFASRPPDAAAVARRALCLATIATLADTADDVQDGSLPVEQGEQFVAEVRDWLTREGLLDAISPRERYLIDKPIGDWSERETIDASWRAEPLGVLLWAISAIPTIPPPDQLFENVLECVPVLAPTNAFVDAAALPPPGAIGDGFAIAALWNWRWGKTQMQREATLTDRPLDIDLHEFVRKAAIRGHEDGLLAAPIDDDFPVRGRAYRDLDNDERGLLGEIAQERHHAFEWLCDARWGWDDTPVIT